MSRKKFLTALFVLVLASAAGAHDFLYRTPVGNRWTRNEDPGHLNGAEEFCFTEDYGD